VVSHALLLAPGALQLLVSLAPPLAQLLSTPLAQA
jgi:hypothetical protein